MLTRTRKKLDCRVRVALGAGKDLQRSGRAGVLPAHLVTLRHAGVLLAASASARSPAVSNGVPLPVWWTVLQVPSRIRLGAAVVDFFVVRAPVAFVEEPRDDDDDAEITVVSPGGVSPLEAVRSRALGSTLLASWRRASTTARVMLGTLALVVIFLIARSSPFAVDEDAPRAPAPAPPVGANGGP